MTLRHRLGLPAHPGPDPALSFAAYGVDANPFPAPYETTDTFAHLNDDGVHPPLYDAFAAFIDHGQSRLAVLEARRGCGATHTLKRLLGEVRGTFIHVGMRPHFTVYAQDPKAGFTALLDQIYGHSLPGLLRCLHQAAAADPQALEALKPSPARGVLRELASQEAFPDGHYARLAAWFVGHATSIETGRGASGSYDTLEGHRKALSSLYEAMGLAGVRPLTFVFLDRFSPLRPAPSGMTREFLSSVRRLLDSQPRDLLVTLAATPRELAAWQGCLPALKTHLEAPFRLPALDSADRAVRLGMHYVHAARRLARNRMDGAPGENPLITQPRMLDIYQRLAASRPAGVPQRDYLSALHLQARDILNAAN